MRTATLALLFGFGLFLLGFVAIVLSLVGLRLSFLAFLDGAGAGISFLVKVLMVFGGVVLMYISRSKFEN